MYSSMRRRKLSSFTTIGLLMLSSNLFAANPIYHFEPEKVQLAGVIEQQTFPGRPGYESIQNGDELERGWYLRLLTPIDVEATNNDTDSNSETERNVKILQLTWTSNNMDSLVRKSVGKRVLFKGHLFHASTGHHHSRVLMWVDAGTVASK
jgi:hypothetical protein